MKKTILIVISKYDLGGIKQALISLLNDIPQGRYDVYLMSLNGGLQVGLYDIPKYVKIIQAPFKEKLCVECGIKSVVSQGIKKKEWFFVLGVLIGWFLSRMFHINVILKKVLFKKSNLEFDYVFNFRGKSLIPSILCEDVCICNKKYIRIHFDLFNLKKKCNLHSQLKIQYLKYKYKYILKYDAIFCVSNEICCILREIYKKQRERIHTLYNIIDKDKIINLGNEAGFIDAFGGLRILSVGRLSREKGFDIACNVCKQLINKGYNIIWYIIGDGRDKNNLLDLIKMNKLENNFKLLGEISNPYPYFKGCDIYVQPSRSESFCIALAEAKIFNKPIIATKFPGAMEQIKDKKTGLLVNISPIDIEKTVEKLIINKDLRNFLSNNLKNEKDDKTMTSKFLDLEQFL